jgi:hypothetical protein
MNKTLKSVLLLFGAFFLLGVVAIAGLFFTLSNHQKQEVKDKEALTVYAQNELVPFLQSKFQADGTFPESSAVQTMRTKSGAFIRYSPVSRDQYNTGPYCKYTLGFVPEMIFGASGGSDEPIEGQKDAAGDCKNEKFLTAYTQSRAAIEAAKQEVNKEFAEISVVIEEYKVKNNKFPAALTDLGLRLELLGSTVGMYNYTSNKECSYWLMGEYYEKGFSDFQGRTIIEANECSAS